MCLAIPGKIVDITDAGSMMRIGVVDFGGVSKEVNLSFVPEAGTGDFVLVHAGIALNTISAVEAERTLEFLEGLDGLDKTTQDG